MIEYFLKDNAIRKLYPEVVTIRGDIAYDKDENIVEYDNSLIEVEINKGIA